MAWENRKGKQYYYRKRREGKRVISEYIGAGLLAAIAEDIDLGERAEADQTRRDVRKQRETAEAIGQQISIVESRIDTITRAILLISGYHPHKRQWRKQRNGRA